MLQRMKNPTSFWGSTEWDIKEKHTEIQACTACHCATPEKIRYQAGLARLQQKITRTVREYDTLPRNSKHNHTYCTYMHIDLDAYRCSVTKV